MLIIYVILKILLMYFLFIACVSYPYFLSIIVFIPLSKVYVVPFLLLYFYFSTVLKSSIIMLFFFTLTLILYMYKDECIANSIEKSTYLAYIVMFSLLIGITIYSIYKPFFYGYYNGLFIQSINFSITSFKNIPTNPLINFSELINNTLLEIIIYLYIYCKLLMNYSWSYNPNIILEDIDKYTIPTYYYLLLYLGILFWLISIIYKHQFFIFLTNITFICSIIPFCIYGFFFKNKLYAFSNIILTMIFNQISIPITYIIISSFLVGLLIDLNKKSLS